MTVPVILLVDPNQDQRAILTALLKSHGYGVLATDDPEEALRWAVERRPDLILGEHPVDLPEGDPLCVALLGNPATAGIPFLALTSRAMPDEILAARASHPAGVLVKPVPLPRLLAEVEVVLARAGDDGQAGGAVDPAGATLDLPAGESA